MEERIITALTIYTGIIIISIAGIATYVYYKWIRHLF
jgi:hypothetical protein